MTCYNLEIHNPTAIIFGTSVTEKVRKQTLFSHLTYLMLCACNTVQLLQCSWLPFSWTMLPKAPSWTHWLQDFGSHTVARIWAVTQKDWRNQAATAADILQCTNTPSENAIFVYSVLPGSAEAQVIWGGIVKRILTAYFIRSISAKKYQKSFTCVKVIASQRWDVFWDTVYRLSTNTSLHSLY